MSSENKIPKMQEEIKIAVPAAVQTIHLYGGLKRKT